MQVVLLRSRLALGFDSGDRRNRIGGAATGAAGGRSRSRPLGALVRPLCPARRGIAEEEERCDGGHSPGAPDRRSADRSPCALPERRRCSGSSSPCADGDLRESSRDAQLVHLASLGFVTLATIVLMRPPPITASRAGTRYRALFTASPRGRCAALALLAQASRDLYVVLQRAGCPQPFPWLRRRCSSSTAPGSGHVPAPAAPCPALRDRRLSRLRRHRLQSAPDGRRALRALLHRPACTPGSPRHRGAAGAAGVRSLPRRKLVVANRGELRLLRRCPAARAQDARGVLDVRARWFCPSGSCTSMVRITTELLPRDPKVRRCGKTRSCASS